MAACLGQLTASRSILRHEQLKAILRSPLKPHLKIISLSVLLLVFFVFLHYRSGDDQEVLFDQILMGQMDFPSPYWDNVSDSAKVSFIVVVVSSTILFPVGGPNTHCPFTVLYLTSHTSPATPINSTGSPIMFYLVTVSDSWWF